MPSLSLVPPSSRLSTAMFACSMSVIVFSMFCCATMSTMSSASTASFARVSHQRGVVPRSYQSRFRHWYCWTLGVAVLWEYLGAGFRHSHNQCERVFFSAVFRPNVTFRHRSFSKRRKWLLVYSVVSEKIVRSRWCFVLWYWEDVATTNKDETWLTWWRILLGAQRWYNSDILSHKHAVMSVRAGEQTVCASCMLWVCILCTPPPRRMVGTAFRQSETRLSCMLCEVKIEKKNHSTALRQIWRNATTMTSSVKWNLAMMKTTKTKYAAGLRAALYTISIVFSDQQRSHNLHVLRIVDTDFDVFVCSDGWVLRVVLFLPWIRLPVADILEKHCNLLFVIVLFPISVLHRVFLSCLNHQMRELQMTLRRPSFGDNLQ